MDRLWKTISEKQADWKLVCGGGNSQDQFGWGPEQYDLMDGRTTHHGRVVGTKWSSSLFPTQAIPCFHDIDSKCLTDYWLMVISCLNDIGK